MKSSKNILLVGLGNPGKRYEMTRHNIGYLLLEAFARRHGMVFKKGLRFCANVAKGEVAGTQVHLLQPLTYMNESGKALFLYLEYYRMALSELLVVTDDTALPFGHLRLREQGSAGGHNGLKSIEHYVKSREYPRLRVGIGKELKGEQQLADYVLEPFSKEECEKLPQCLESGVQILDALLLEPLSSVMNRFNEKI